MAGRAYTMKEMKGIVEYLKERKAYSEIRGRKMWMDYASSNLTSRTWQSLKETFLKRILPDIHNPYYSLKQDEIRSFRQGHDLTNNTRIKLELRSTITENNGKDDAQSNGDAVNNNNNPETNNPSQSIHSPENESGENITCSKIAPNRDSVDTVIILTNTEEDVIKNTSAEAKQEVSPDDKENYEVKPTAEARSPKKSLRDCFSYEKPLTPMMVQLMEDFQSDPESSSADNVQENRTNTDTEKADENIEKSDSETNRESNDFQQMKRSVKRSLRLKQTQELSGNDSSHTTPEKKHKTVTLFNQAGTDSDSDDSTALRICEVVMDVNESGKEDSEKSTTKKSDSAVTAGDKVSVPDIHLKNGESEQITPEKETKTGNKKKSLGKKSKKIKSPSIGQADVQLDTPVETNNSTPEKVQKNKSPSKKSSTKTVTDAVKGSQNTQILSLTDSSLPNNQEGLGNKLQDKTVTRLQVHASSSELECQKPVTKQTKKKLNLSRSPMKKRHSVKRNIEEELLISDDEQPLIINNNIADVPTTAKTPNKSPKKVNEVDKNEINQSPNTITQSNPCLQSVSLFAEQFVVPDNSDSSDSVLGTPPIQKALAKQNNLPLSKPALPSHSDDDSDNDVEVLSPTRKKGERKSRKQKTRLFDNLFGIPDSRKSRRRGCHRRSMSMSQHTVEINSNSSGWSSESDSDFVSPPRSRNRHSRKYLKPHSGRIFALEQQGGLFVVDRKKIYPIVRDGKIIKNFTLLHSDSETDEESESYWKLKYIEERKKNAELKKTILGTLPSNNNKQLTMKTQSPIIRSRSDKNKEDNEVIDVPSSSNGDNDKDAVIVKDSEAERKNSQTVKIKFDKKNEEISVEGQWKNLHQILPDVMQMFHKEEEESKNVNALNKPKAAEKRTSSRKSSSDVVVSSNSEDVHKKIDKLEAEIFKEIEEREKEAESEKDNKESSVPKVTTRRLRPAKRDSSATSPRVTNSRPKRARTSENDRSDSEIIVNENKLRPIENKVDERQSPTSEKRVLRKSRNETNPEPVKTAKTRKATSRKNSVDSMDDSQTLYKFPSPGLQDKSTRASRSKIHDASKENVPTVCLPSFQSPESTQGYRESDDSPIQNNLRKKKKIYPSYQCRGKRFTRSTLRRKSYELSPTDASNESSNSLPPIAKFSATENTEIYRTDSYQLIMNKDLNSLKAIPEMSPCPNEINSECGDNSFHLSPALQIMNKSTSNASVSHDNCNSSSVSLPLSPELSIVENITISKTILNSIAAHPTINETESIDAMTVIENNNYVLSQIDVSVPLMEQDCRFKESYRKGTDNVSFENSSIDKMEIQSSVTVNSPVTNGMTVTESLINNIDTVSLKDVPSISDMLDHKLTELILDSTKKDKAKTKAQTDKAKKPTKAANKKRCSTPRKKKDVVKSILVEPNEVVIQEEQMEFCASGRKSCPPVIHTVTHATDTNNEQKENDLNITKRKARKQKEIIKVKILKPRDKNKSSNDKKNKKSTLSLHADSGINDTTTSAILDELSDTVDLIHNHTETCLQANECFNDSVEIVENSKSIISIDTSSSQDMDVDAVLSALSFGKPDDDASVDKVSRIHDLDPSPQSVHTNKTSARSLNSLMTEDLSNEVPLSEPPSWFLLSDDEAAKPMPEENRSRLTNFAANLQEIFPVVCSFPDLSTITEMSRDTDTQQATGQQDLSPKECIMSDDDNFFTCQC